ncbi:MAG: hypothetical protein JXR29_07440 [Methylothermaceae bacterium]|nr:hypothetical protein [Methylothermaceae bacterium]
MEGRRPGTGIGAERTQSAAVEHDKTHYDKLVVSVHPNFVILPFALLFGISVAVAASMFKKYL